MATELGLHRDGRRWNLTEEQIERRSRVFWVTYVMEVTVAFNYGRPPSIAYYAIDVPFPRETPQTVMPIYTMRQRLLQGRVIEELYSFKPNFGPNLNRSATVLVELQAELDALHFALPELYKRANTPYCEE